MKGEGYPKYERKMNKTVKDHYNRLIHNKSPDRPAEPEPKPKPKPKAAMTQAEKDKALQDNKFNITARAQQINEVNRRRKKLMEDTKGY